MIFGFAAGRNMFSTPDYNLLCPGTIMSNTFFGGPGILIWKLFIYNTSLLQSCSITMVSKYIANQMKCEFKAAFALTLVKCSVTRSYNLAVLCQGNHNSSTSWRENFNKHKLALSLEKVHSDWGVQVVIFSLNGSPPIPALLHFKHCIF